mgnify:FL=1
MLQNQWRCLFLIGTRNLNKKSHTIFRALCLLIVFLYFEEKLRLLFIVCWLYTISSICCGICSIEGYAG